MSLRQQEPGFGQLSPIESVDDYCFGNRRISHDENNDFNGKMGVDDFRSECGDDDVTATNVNQMEMHRLPFFSVDQILERQDSLARVATLQECDRNRDPNGILDFLETTMNIEDYLDDIHAAAEIPLDSIDHEDIALQKCKTACQGDQLSKYHANDSFSHNSHYDDIQGYLFSTALTLSTPDLKSALPKIKDEPYWEGNPSTSSTLSQKKQRRNVQAPEAYSPSSYTPATTPRKYRLKTPQERNNTLYKVKRQRNNDAVRKSRSKAKQLQMMKEKQLEEALLENKELKEKLRIVNERLSSCRCQN